MENGYLTFSSDNSFTLTVTTNTNYNGSLQFSTDTTTWNEVTRGTAISSVNHKIYLRGSGNYYCRQGVADLSGNTPVFILSGSNIRCDGNIETLLDYQTVLNGEHPETRGNYTYRQMFLNCTGLVSAPELPATDLLYGCYHKMFSGCTSLTTAPALPAIVVNDFSYGSMFSDCTSLTQAPELPATTLIGWCYEGMFARCTSLTQAPALPATVLSPLCYESMFHGCTSLIIPPELPATTLAKRCYRGMFNGCTSLLFLPQLPAIKLAKECYYEMFKNCTSLKIRYNSGYYSGTYYTVPYRIPSGTETGETAENALYGMFTGIGVVSGVGSTPSLNTTYYVPSIVYGYTLRVNGKPLNTINGHKINTMLYNKTTYIITDTPSSNNTSNEIV